MTSETPAWSSTPSNLPGASNIYDFVIAVTQNSINTNLDKFFAEGLASADQPITEVYYAYDAANDPEPVAISLSDLLAQSNNVNPFDVPDNAGPHDQRLIDLASAGFGFAIRAKMGKPDVNSGVTLPGWVDFSNNSSAQVTFNMMCSTFTACAMTHLPREAIGWTNYSQTQHSLLSSKPPST